MAKGWIIKADTIEELAGKLGRDPEALKATIDETKKDSAMNDADKSAKIKKCEDKIAALQKKCKEQTENWLREQKEDERKAKERFAAK